MKVSVDFLLFLIIFFFKKYCVLDPGNVRDLNWNGNLSSVYLSWYVPEKNPQCVELYEIDWKNQKATTRDTFFILDNLTPCSKFLVTVSTSGPISHRRTSPTLKQSGMPQIFIFLLLLYRFFN